MPKYLLHGSYTLEGVRGLLKDGGTKRRAVVDELVKGIGGSLEAFHYGYGDSDVYVIVDVTATAASLAINASGAVNLKTTVLITPEEVDEAVKKSVPYRPPGG